MTPLTTAVDATLRVAKLPLDLALGALGQESAQVVLDRADATVRTVAGTALRDDELLADAGRRREAAEERGRALRLRAEAELREQRGEETAEQRREAAAARRRRATQKARTERKRAEERREGVTTEAARAEQRRRAANDRAAAEAEDTIEARNRKTKLEQLDTEAEALGEREAALTARDEADRLAGAAAAAKAERKRST
jgi:hypothetical protein